MEENIKIDPFYFCSNCKKELSPLDVNHNNNCKYCGDKTQKLNIENVEDAERYLKLHGINVDRI